jgi:hypothetical protein
MLVAAQLCSRADRGLAFARSRLLTAALDGMTIGRDMQGADVRAVVLRVVDEELPRQRWRPDGG